MTNACRNASTTTATTAPSVTIADDILGHPLLHLIQSDTHQILTKGQANRYQCAFLQLSVTNPTMLTCLKMAIMARYKFTDRKFS